MAESESHPTSAAPTTRPHRKGLAFMLTLVVITLLAGGAWWLAQRGKAPAAGAGGFGPGRGGGGAGVTVGAAVPSRARCPWWSMRWAR